MAPPSRPLTDEEDRLLRKLVEGGKSKRQIDAALPHLSRYKIEYELRKRGLKLQGRLHGNGGPRPTQAWPKARLDRLKALWAEGKGPCEIARIMKTTNNTIIGKANRLGLPRRDAPNSQRRKTRAGGKKPFIELTPAQIEAQRAAREAAEKERRAEAQERLDAAAQGALNVPMVRTRRRRREQHENTRVRYYRVCEAMGRDQCRFPMNAAGPYLFCGKPVAEGRSYCSAHHDICVNGAEFNMVGALRAAGIKPEKAAADEAK